VIAEEQLLDDLRPAAFGIAYRMLGSVAEAEDVVQEALVTLHGVRIPGATIRPAEVNGGPGALLLDEHERVIAVWAIEIDGERIQRISSIVNPDKLGHLGRLSDVRTLRRQVAAR
jgi:hypothetical protein